MTQRVSHAVVGDGRLGANSVDPICITGSLGDISKFDIIQAVSVFQIVHLDMKVDSSSLGVRVLFFFPGLSLSAEVLPVFVSAVSLEERVETSILTTTMSS